MNTRKHRPILLGQSDTVYEQQVQQEIETYLNALNSYPGRFEQEPADQDEDDGERGEADLPEEREEALGGVSHRADLQ